MLLRVVVALPLCPPQALYFSFGKVTTASYGSSTTAQSTTAQSSRQNGRSRENANIQKITQERKWAGEHKSDSWQQQVVVAVPVSADPPPTRHAWSSPSASSTKQQVSCFGIARFDTRVTLR